MRHMKPEEVREKVGKLISPCPCGSGKQYHLCCGANLVAEVADETCPCGSGKKVKDCCLKSPAAQASA
ncbi:MAG: SEC-C metal-binding domain-containing protein [Patescibacteria group bacterium]|nr:SEC-C metal-binding domain-containing protein [Patescibacteria group bacterium]